MNCVVDMRLRMAPLAHPCHVAYGEIRLDRGLSPATLYREWFDELAGRSNIHAQLWSVDLSAL